MKDTLKFNIMITFKNRVKINNWPVDNIGPFETIEKAYEYMDKNYGLKNYMYNLNSIFVPIDPRK